MSGRRRRSSAVRTPASSTRSFCHSGGTVGRNERRREREPVQLGACSVRLPYSLRYPQCPAASAGGSWHNVAAYVAVARDAYRHDISNHFETHSGATHTFGVLCFDCSQSELREALRCALSPPPASAPPRPPLHSSPFLKQLRRQPPKDAPLPRQPRRTSPSPLRK